MLLFRIRAALRRLLSFQHSKLRCTL